MLFDFVRSPKVVPKVLAVALIWQFPFFIVHLSGLFGIPVIHQQELAIFVLVVTLVVGLLILWIMLRLFLLPYLFVTNPQESVPVMIKSSFRIMKGQVRHLLWFGITVYWWPILLLFGLTFLITPVSDLMVGNSARPEWLVFQLIVSLIMVLCYPYIDLALTGYANELLPSARDKG